VRKASQRPGVAALYLTLFIVMSRETVREAAYTYQPDTRLNATTEPYD
jgi:hypothetical protein